LYWEALREHQLGFFDASKPLWRLSVAQTASPLGLSMPQLIEWGGGQRWLVGDAALGAVRDAAQKGRGHATRFRGGERSGAGRAAGGPGGRAPG